MKITHINYRPSENQETLEALILYMPPLSVIIACERSNVEKPKSLKDLCFLKDEKGNYYLARYFDYRDPEPIIFFNEYTPPQEGWRAI